MDVNDSVELKLTMAAQASPATCEADKVASVMVDKYPIPFKLAVQLTLEMLSHVLKYPIWKPSPFACSTLNPYLTTVPCNVGFYSVNEMWARCILVVTLSSLPASCTL